MSPTSATLLFELAMAEGKLFYAPLSNYRWNTELPVRRGILKNCYKTGEGENSAAHFYFELKEGVLPGTNFQDQFREIYAEYFQRAYAYLTFSDISYMITKKNSKTIFEEQCMKFFDAGLNFNNGQKEIMYDPPLMVLIEGMYKKSGFRAKNAIKPKYDSFAGKTFYEFVESKSYYIKFRTFSSNYKNPFQVKMLFLKDSFFTPKEYTQNIYSPYYRECWEIQPSYIEKDSRGYFIFIIEALKKTKNQLNWKIITTYEIKRKLGLRFCDVLIDFLIVLGPAYLAVTKIVENINPKPWYITNWLYIFLGIYGIWFIAKLIRNLIRGK